jgi:hypothetical protein
VYCVTVAFTMTERADQLHHDIAPAHSTALVQSFFGKTSHHPGLSASLQPRFDSLQLLAFPKAKIAFEREEICECDGHTLHTLSLFTHFTLSVCSHITHTYSVHTLHTLSLFTHYTLSVCSHITHSQSVHTLNTLSLFTHYTLSVNVILLPSD